MKIRQYRPAFVSGFESETIEFETQEELLNVEFVKNFSKTNGFHRYSISDPWDSSSHTLMAEYDLGYEWWVIGFIDDINNLNLPEWKPKYRDK